MCRVLDISRGGYYDWRHRPDSKRAERHKVLVSKIETIHEETGDCEDTTILAAAVPRRLGHGVLPDPHGAAVSTLSVLCRP